MKMKSIFDDHMKRQNPKNAPRERKYTMEVQQKSGAWRGVDFWADFDSWLSEGVDMNPGTSDNDVVLSLPAAFIAPASSFCSRANMQL